MKIAITGSIGIIKNREKAKARVVRLDKKIKAGDTVQRKYKLVTGDKTIEGVVLKKNINKISGDSWLRIAVKGNLNYKILSPEKKCRKIDKKYKLHESGQMKLFKEV